MTQKLLAFAATLLASTLRIQWKGEPMPARSVAMFWHGTMFAGWWAVHKLKPIALVSQSKDGEYLSAVLAKWQYQLVRGSSSKQGWEALREGMAAIEHHTANTLAITPDGPRGPQHLFKRGAFVAAKELNVPLVFLRIEFSNALTMKRSWDRFKVPMPFSRIVVTVQRVALDTFPSD